MDKSERHSAIVLGVLFALIVCCGGTFLFTKDYYTRAGNAKWQAGYDKGHSAGLAEVGPRIADDEAKLAQMNDKYNSLVADYNSLRDTVLRYVSSTQYQSKQPIHCTSYSYGLDSAFTSTNCY